MSNLIIEWGGGILAWKIRENQNGSSELYHYGVKGMRWGIRKDYKTSGSSKKSTSPRLNPSTDQFLKFNITKTTPVGKAEIKTIDGDKHWRDASKTTLDFIKNAVEDRYAPTEVAVETLKNLPRQKEIEDGRAFDFIPKSKHLDRMDYNAQLLATNHDANTYMRNINCFECSMAYELRRRGYNVQSKEMNGGFGCEVEHAFNVKDAFTINIEPKNASMDKSELAKEAYRQMESRCLEYGEGARGCLGIQYYDYDSGHSMFWVVENGKFKILDTQHNGDDGYETFLHAETVDTPITIYRLDNADVLPGVTDFVEPYEISEEAKKELDEKTKNKITNIAKKKAAAKKKATSKKNETKVKKLINKIGKDASGFISKGKEAIGKFLKNPLNIQKKTATVSRGDVTSTKTR